MHSDSTLLLLLEQMRSLFARPLFFSLFSQSSHQTSNYFSYFSVFSSTPPLSHTEESPSTHHWAIIRCRGAYWNCYNNSIVNRSLKSDKNLKSHTVPIYSHIRAKLWKRNEKNYQEFYSLIRKLCAHTFWAVVRPHQRRELRIRMRSGRVTEATGRQQQTENFMHSIDFMCMFGFFFFLVFQTHNTNIL